MMSISSFSTWPVFMRIAAAMASGALMVLALAPFNVTVFMFLGFSAFYFILSSATKTRTAFMYGWFFGFGYFVFGLSWIGNALLVDGNKFLWAWPFVIAGLPALLSFFTATACALIVRFGELRKLSGLLLFVSLTMVFEWLRGHIFTGFPWNLYGYTWAGSLPMAQLASIGGIYWLSLLTCLWATLPGFLVIGQGKRRLKIALTIFLITSLGGSYYYGQKRLDTHSTRLRNDIAIKIVQPNIAQKDKWKRGKTRENLQKILELSEAEKVNDFISTVIIWPETAISDYLLQDENARTAIKTVLSAYEKPVHLLSGVLRHETDDNGKKQYFNSLMAFDSKLNVIATYDKSHLVPFGEYVPLQKWLNLKPFVKFSGFKQGGGPQNINIAGIGSFTPLVCYEIIFPGAVTSKTERPDFIVNPTNDAWYGDSSGPRQHFVQTQFRAIEEGVPVIRAANTGISAIIDAMGRITYRVNLGKQSGRSAALPQKTPKPTIYAKSKDVLFFVTLTLALILSFYFQMDNKNKKKD